jgi:large subunit ribosomal protein L4
MPQLAVYDMAGEKTADIDVPDEILGIPFNADLVHQALVAVEHQRKRRCGKTKTRGDVDMTTAKWYRQKGTGRARHGDQSPPHFVGGGVAHGPKGITGSHRIPRKMRQKAKLCALSSRAYHGAVTVVEKFELEKISTRRFAQALDDLDLKGKILLLLDAEEARDEVLYKSARNIPNLVARPVPHFSVRDVLWADEIVFTRAALAQLVGGDAGDAE